MSYVITNGQAFLTEFRLEGRGYRYSFRPKGAILFDNEAEARIILAMLSGLTAWDFDLDCSTWEIKKTVPVKPCAVKRDVSKKWADAYIRCKKAADKDGYIYCRNCGNHGCFGICPDDPEASLEFCINYL